MYENGYLASRTNRHAIHNPPSCNQQRSAVLGVSSTAERMLHPNQSSLRLQCTVVTAMGGHTWDQAKVSVHDRWPLIRGTGWVGLRQTHYTVHNSIMQHHQRYIRSEYMHWCIMHGIIMVPKLNEITIYSTVYTHTFIHSTISAYNVHGNRGMFWHFPLYQVLTTNKWLSASALGRWPLIAGRPTLTLKCVGTLIMCPYMTGGRSRRGSPKAGTTVLRMRSSSPLTSWHFKSGYLFVIASRII